eukprot:CAMPEP_0170240230 /NCGR_PEP_ID=MMETSP0116_2-20130129/19873_1 /TAXON_ID=400756 /ORGANISM="Durinskia baltica, Strain CSIRO CS-38" /LENGTH=247 /DNA_ID=CAMNT_0010491049 /DNA_START=47 /DNA_END=788 /DNA_ORIENTATION=+
MARMSTEDVPPWCQPAVRASHLARRMCATVMSAEILAKYRSPQVLPLQEARLHDGESPIFAAVVARALHPRASLCLLLVQAAEDAVDDGHAVRQVQVHDALGHGFADVLEMHGLALDEAADAHYAIEALRLQETPGRERDLVGPGDVLHDDVLDTASLQRLHAPGRQGIAHHGIPPRADNRYLEARAVKNGEVQASDRLGAVRIRRVLQLALLLIGGAGHISEGRQWQRPERGARKCASGSRPGLTN